MAKVLLVDDESNVLDGYRRTLRKQFKISTALSGKEGLSKLKEEGPFAAVVSDMKMPEMNGVEFLQAVKKRYPKVIRLMLTGNADQETAISAINEGDVFRFLNKPCSPDDMAFALNAAIEKHRAHLIEKRLLQETLNGAIKGLLDILSITNPDVFGQTTHIVQRAKECAVQLGWDTSWELETSARLCLVGLVTVPHEISAKVIHRKPLTNDETALFRGFPEAGAKLVENIPRMKRVADNIRYLLYENLGEQVTLDEIRIPRISKLLRLIVDFQGLLKAEFEVDEAIEIIITKKNLYDQDIVKALIDAVSQQVEKVKQLVNIKVLGTNMYLAKELISENGAVLVSKNQHISESLANRLFNFYQSGLIDEQLYVYIEGDSEPYC